MKYNIIKSPKTIEPFRMIVKCTFAIDNKEIMKMMSKDGFQRGQYRRSDVMAKVLDGEPMDYVEHITEMNIEQIYFSDEIQED